MSYLESTSKFLLNPLRHRRVYSTTRQEQEILEIYDLRENRQPFVKVLSVLWWSPIRRDKLESRSVNSRTGLLNVWVSEGTQSHD